MINVIVADDHAVVRTGLQLFFQDNAHISIKEEAKNGNELLERLKHNAFDVAIVDLNMPGIDSLDLISQLAEKHPKLPLVILSMNTDDQLISRLFKLGVSAFISKEESPTEIEKALLKASQNQKYLTPYQEKLFANQFIQGTESDLPHTKLTDREYQIMCMLSSGKTNTCIADKLRISKNTISNHRNHILKKLSMHNNAELTKYAIQYSLIN